MLPFTFNLKSKLHLYGGIVCSLLLISCGSYQNAGYEDGIYAPNPKDSNYTAAQTPQSNNQVVRNSNGDDGYYQNYFAKQGEQIAEAQDYNNESQVFTDVESYSSNNEPNSNREANSYNENINYNAGNAGWGANPTTVEVNYINTGFNNPYWYGGGYGYGGFYNNWNYGWGYSPYSNWNIGFSWGWGNYYRPWGGYYGYNNPYYYNSYYNPYYNNYGYYGYNGRVAYHNSGRSNYNNGRSNLDRNRSNYSSTRNNTTRSSATRNTNTRNDVSTRSRVRNSNNINANPRTRSVSRNRTNE